MRLISLTYHEFQGQEAEWNLNGLTLSHINLLVAKNATGKTRTINVINSLAGLLSGERKEVFANFLYKAVFEESGKKWAYVLEGDNSTVVMEDLSRGDEHLLQRGKGGYAGLARTLGKLGRLAPALSASYTVLRDVARNGSRRMGYGQGPARLPR